MKVGFANPRTISRLMLLALVLIFVATPMYAQTSPIGQMLQNWSDEVQGTTGKAICFLIIIAGAVSFWASEGRNKGGLVTAFLVVMIIQGSARVLSWLS